LWFSSPATAAATTVKILLQEHHCHQQMQHLQQEETCKQLTTVQCSIILNHSSIPQFTSKLVILNKELTGKCRQATHKVSTTPCTS
jgi:hypothetical protein